MRFICNWFVKITGFLPQLFVFKTKVYYEDKAVQSRRIKGKAIVISNHNYLMDFAVLMFVFWRRTLRCAVAEVMYHKNFLMTFLLKALGCVKVERDDHDFSFLTKLKGILDRGGIVEIYPEARLPKKGESRPLEFKASYVYLALESGAPIIPVYSNAKLFGKERERVIIGKPILVGELYDHNLTEKENIKNINEYIRSKIIELGKELEQKEEKEKAVF
ncbi:MAG: 1-acyl-sn-glycerol-3-phosphate acyltransferase [Clostridia bacterium]|nr:1-acyl-sn-glycerol-3-phosphate acyltransferase [Clostridia bacterium]